MVIRVVTARLIRGMRPEYVRLCDEKTIPLMGKVTGYLDRKICDSRAKRPDDVVFATLWREEQDIQVFVQTHADGGNWRDMKILPWEKDVVVDASVSLFHDDYTSLVTMWRTVSPVVEKRNGALDAVKLSDEQWQLIAPILDPVGASRIGRGRPRIHSRIALDAVLHVVLTGAFWYQIPNGVSAATSWRRFREWEDNGNWEQVWRNLLATVDAQTRQDWILSFLDCAHVPIKRRA
jgi:transposase